MNKSSNSNPPNNIHIDEDWTANPAIEWLSQHKSIFIWSFLALIAILILASRLITWRTLDAEKDFFQAQTAFTQFEQAAGSADASAILTELEQLQAIMQRHPELKPKYDGSLAQTLLMTRQIPQVQPIIEDILTRTEADHLQLYQNYTKTSLLIGQERYADALQSTKQLKSDLNQLGEKKNPVLYAFNLIRLAILFQQTGQPQEELKTWEELQQYTRQSKTALLAHQAYQVGNASLSQYIEERKQVLAH